MKKNMKKALIILVFVAVLFLLNSGIVAADCGSCKCHDGDVEYRCGAHTNPCTRDWRWCDCCCTKIPIIGCVDRGWGRWYAVGGCPLGTSCGTKTCPSDYYFESGADSPTGTNYCYLRDYADSCTKECGNKDEICHDCECSYEDKVVATCGICKYVDKCSSSKQTCANYPYGTACGGGKRCDGNGNCGELDADGDGVLNKYDNCPNVANANQNNSDTDTLGDACDNCPNVATLDQLDWDIDGVGNACDNCWHVSNPGQEDTYGKICPSPPYNSDPLCGDACEPKLSRAYWADMRGNNLTETQINDTVQLVLEGINCNGLAVNFKIWEGGGTSCHNEEIQGLIRFENNKAIAVWPVLYCEDGIPKANDGFYFEASLADYSDIKSASGKLTVSPTARNSNPVAKITFPNHDKKENYFFKTNDRINFTQASYDVDDTITYLWDFGDGNTSVEANPIYAYTKGGPQKVALTVKDARGLNATDKIEILIDMPNWNDNPLVIISYPKEGFTYAIGLVRCDASKSIDDTTLFDNLIFRWKFNDICDEGCSGGRGCPGAKGKYGNKTGAVCPHVFTEAGRKIVKVEVEGSVSTAAATFFIAEEVPETEKEEEAKEEIKTAVQVPYLTIAALLIAALVVFLIVRRLKTKTAKARKRRESKRK